MFFKKKKEKEKEKNPSKNHWFGQKRGASKRAVSLMYLITNLRIS